MEEKALETGERKKFVIQSSERLGESNLAKGGGLWGGQRCSLMEQD